MTTLRCISLWQPWASLLVGGKKRCETRSFAVPPGWLLIHAAQKWDRRLMTMARYTPAFKSALSELGLTAWHRGPSRSLAKLVGMPLGAIVGAVRVVECFPTAAVRLTTEGNATVEFESGGRVLCVTPTEQAFGDYSPSRSAWLCADAVALVRPIPCVGRQFLWNVPAADLPADLLDVIEQPRGEPCPTS